MSQYNISLQLHINGRGANHQDAGLLLASFGLLCILLPATNRVLMDFVREILAVIFVLLTVSLSVVATILRCGPFESVGIELRGLEWIIVSAQWHGDVQLFGLPSCLLHPHAAQATRKLA